MAELFLSKFPSEVVTRPVDAERDKLLRDWEPSRRERLEQRWDKVMQERKSTPLNYIHRTLYRMAS